MLEKRFFVCVLLAAAGLAVAGCGGGSDRKAAQLYIPELEQGRLGVNGYLWQASLDTLDFIALDSTDSQGGVIVTEWYSSPEAPDERFKIVVRILDRSLRSDALRVSVHRQERRQSGWQDAPVRAGTVARLEEAILTRARQLRIATVEGG